MLADPKRNRQNYLKNVIYTLVCLFKQTINARRQVYYTLKCTLYNAIQLWGMHAYAMRDSTTKRIFPSTKGHTLQPLNELNYINDKHGYWLELDEEKMREKKSNINDCELFSSFECVAELPEYTSHLGSRGGRCCCCLQLLICMTKKEFLDRLAVPSVN